MRISDWSSDVCSSDLQPRGAESVRRTIYQLRQRHPAADRQFLQLRGPWPHLHARLGLSLLMMKLLDTLHRWTGGLIGLLLALMGLSGTILLYEHLWIGVPGAGDPLRGALAPVAAPTERLMAPPGPPGHI